MAWDICNEYRWDDSTTWSICISVPKGHLQGYKNRSESWEEGSKAELGASGKATQSPTTTMDWNENKNLFF